MSVSQAFRVSYSLLGGNCFLASLSVQHAPCRVRACCVPLQKDLFTDKTGEYWGKFGAVQDDIQQAYSGNAAATVDQASMGSFRG